MFEHHWQPIPELTGELPRTLPSNNQQTGGQAVVLTNEELDDFVTGRHEVGVVVPAYNEELVIGDSLESLTKVVSPEHIYLVSDGSTDRTAAIARQHVDNILDLPENVGKARALETLIRHFKLIDRYRYILFADADSQLDRHFLREARAFTREDPACVVGKVVSHRRGLISAYRSYEYALSHLIFKRSQNLVESVAVAPGCASLYRSDIIESLDFSRHTLTEDFDLTLQIHEKNLGRVVYAPKAKVITQDPTDLADYWRQISRWYTGFWQNVFIHKIYKPNHPVNMEIWLSLFDSLSWIILLLIALRAPITAAWLLIFSYLVTVMLASVVLVIERQVWAVKYVFFLSAFQFINTLCYLHSFYRAIRWGSNRLAWGKTSRYAFGR